MESSTTLDPGVVHAPDLEAVVCAGGPVLTVYLDTQRTTDNASHRSEQRWHSLRRSLARLGADPGALDAVDPLVADAHLRGDCLAVVAGAEGVRHVEHGAVAPPASAGWWAPLPRLAPV